MPLPTTFLARQVLFAISVDNSTFDVPLTFTVSVLTPAAEARNDAAHAAALAAFSSLKSAFPGSVITLFRTYEGTDVATDITPEQ